MKPWRITAKLLLVPVLSVALLVAALAFTVYTESRYEGYTQQGVSRSIEEGRRYGSTLTTALTLHSRYLELAAARIAGAAADADPLALKALHGATGDLRQQLRGFGRTATDPASVAPLLTNADGALTDFDAMISRLAAPRDAAGIRSDISQSNATFTRLTAALTEMISGTEIRAERSLAETDRYVRQSLLGLAALMVLIGLLAAGMTAWATRAVASPLRAVAAAMRRFREDPSTASVLAERSEDEVGEIVHGFNDLVATVQERARTVADATHQLRESNWALQNEARERRLADHELRRSREFLEVAQSAGGTGVFHLDLETRLMLGSGSFFSLQGIDPKIGAITQDQWLALVHPDDLEILVSAFSAAVEAGGTYRAEYRIYRIDRTVRWVLSSGYVITDVEAGARRIVGSIMDITERKQSELALRATEARLAGAVRGTSDGLFEYNLDSGHIWFAPRAAELLDYAPADFPSTADGFNALVHPDDQARNIRSVTEHVRHGLPHDVEFRIRDAAGAWQWFRSRAQARRDADTDAIILAGSLQLVTDRRRQAEELEAARAAAEQANRSKSDFLANMSHEIRTPINGVIGMTNVLLDTPLTQSQRECAEIAQSSAEALLALINDILDFSKIEAGMMRLEQVPLDLRSVVDDALGSVALVALGKDLDVVADVAEDVPDTVIGDPGRLRQCLINLIGNAVKFTAAGHVVVTVRCAAAQHAKLQLKVVVTDTGIGIPANRLGQLFKDFSQIDSSTTRHYGGTGLGLSIVSRLARLMGGDVGVESVEGVGSSFWFTAELERSETEAETASTAGEVNGTRVVILESLSIAGRAMARELERVGCQVTLLNGKTPLVPTLGLDAPDTDVIMVDTRLLSPEVSALLEAAKSRDPAVRTVLLAPIGLIAAPPRGFDAVLSKPVRRRPLLQCVERLRGVASPEIERAVTAADTRRVLLVDDNAVNRRVAEHQLRKYDCIVTSACDGVAGVAAAMSDDYDLILMDCQMPLLDGFDATRQIRMREQPGMRVPIIALTANAMAGDRELCLTAGMDDYLAKPLDPVALATCIDRWAPRSRSALRASAPLLVTIAEPAPQASPITPPIDLAALAVVTDGEADFERELMAVFVASGDATLAAIVDAVNSGDLSAVKRHAHTLKGASANLRALPLAECAQALENAATQGDLQRCRGVLGDVQSDYRRTTEFISAHGA